jgi:predicted RNA binding protein YcfA (HicA-like mRNA interferase family)
MPKSARIPPLSGKKLIRLLEKDGWVVKRRATHGVSMTKQFSERVRVTVVPQSNALLDDGTLAAILSPKQTNIGKAGLIELVNKYGI